MCQDKLSAHAVCWITGIAVMITPRDIVRIPIHRILGPHDVGRWTYDTCGATCVSLCVCTTKQTAFSHSSTSFCVPQAC